MNADNPTTVPNKEKDRQNVNIAINVLYTTHMNSILITQKRGARDSNPIVCHDRLETYPNRQYFADSVHLHILLLVTGIGACR